jgi:hypothetical protein
MSFNILGMASTHALQYDLTSSVSYAAVSTL